MKLVLALGSYILFMFVMAVAGLPLFIVGFYKPHWLKESVLVFRQLSYKFNTRRRA
jgi:hypothetical protein